MSENQFLLHKIEQNFSSNTNKSLQLNGEQFSEERKAK